jgi:hypothetical protein
MTGTINQMARQAQTDELLRQAAEARAHRGVGQTKDSGSRFSGLRRPRLSTSLGSWAVSRRPGARRA